MGLSGFKLDKYATLALVVAGIFIAYKVYRAGSWVVDGVSGMVGSVVDAAGTVANVVGDALTGETAAEVMAACNAALKAKGVNPDNYWFMYPQPTPGTKLPPGSWVVTYKGKRYYFAKKGTTPYSFYSL